MCLDLTNDSVSRIAEDDIICYKVLEVASDNTLCSPFQLMPYEFNKVMLSELRGYGNIRSMYIEEGLHSFADFYNSLALTQYNGAWKCFVAIIPKGAEYYSGTNDEQHIPGYASTQLIVLSPDDRRSIEAMKGNV